jgi:hypothetical protein
MRGATDTNTIYPLHCAPVGMIDYVDDFRDNHLEAEAAVHGE